MSNFFSGFFHDIGAMYRIGLSSNKSNLPPPQTAHPSPTNQKADWDDPFNQTSTEPTTVTTTSDPAQDSANTDPVDLYPELRSVKNPKGAAANGFLGATGDDSGLLNRSSGQAAKTAAKPLSSNANPAEQPPAATPDPGPADPPALVPEAEPVEPEPTPSNPPVPPKREKQSFSEQVKEAINKSGGSTEPKRANHVVFTASGVSPNGKTLPGTYQVLFTVDGKLTSIHGLLENHFGASLDWMLGLPHKPYVITGKVEDGECADPLPVDDLAVSNTILRHFDRRLAEYVEDTYSYFGYTPSKYQDSADIINRVKATAKGEPEKHYIDVGDESPNSVTPSPVSDPADPPAPVPEAEPAEPEPISITESASAVENVDLEPVDESNNHDSDDDFGYGHRGSHMAPMTPWG